jgi:hypothetical protein
MPSWHEQGQLTLPHPNYFLHFKTVQIVFGPSFPKQLLDLLQVLPPG